MKNKRRQLVTDDNYDPSNPDHVAALKHENEYEREMELNDLRYILNQPEGKRIFKRIIANLYDSSFTGNSATFHKEGMRLVATNIARELKAASREIAAEILVDIL